MGIQCQEKNCEINLYNENEGYGICDRKMVEVSSRDRAGAAVLDRARSVASALQETVSITVHEFFPSMYLLISSR